MVELKQAYDAHELKLAQVRKEKAETFERARRVGEANKVAIEMETLIGKLQGQQDQYEMAKGLLAKTERQMIDLPLGDKSGNSKDPFNYSPETSALDSTDGIYRRLVQQYYLIQMELNSPPRVKLIQAASTPTQKDARKQIIGTVFAGLLGFGLMALGVVAFESMTRRVSSLADVKGATPVPVVGVIPCPPGGANSRDPMKLAAANEALDKLRTYVSQTWLARGATTVAVTCPMATKEGLRRVRTRQQPRAERLQDTARRLRPSGSATPLACRSRQRARHLRVVACRNRPRDRDPVPAERASSGSMRKMVGGGA